MVGGAMWSAPRAEQSQFQGQAIPARGGKLLGEGTRSTPQIRTSQSPHQAIPATDGGASRCGEARRRSGVHVVRTMISEVPASRGRMPLNDWSWADRHEGEARAGPGSSASAVAARWLPEPRGGANWPERRGGECGAATGTQDQAETVGSPQRSSGQWSGAMFRPTTASRGRTGPA